MLKIFKKYFLILSLVVLAVSTAGIHLTKAVIFFPSSNVAGIVTDSDTGQPLANASVRLHGGPFFDTTVLTDSNGLYDIFVDFCGNNLTIEATPLA